MPILVACGGGSTGGNGAANSGASPQVAASGGTGGSDSGGSGSAGGSGSGGGTATTSRAGSLTPPGTRLGFGRPATVAWVPPLSGSATGAHKGIKLQVTVESIQRGSIADFKNVELNASERKSTPYYVTVRIKALASTPLPGSDNDPAITFDAIDDRGQQQQSVTFFGTFQRCDDPAAPKPFVSGKSYQSCLTYLMPGGGSIQQVEWKDGPSKADEVTPYFEKPIVWGGS
ncbi:MAG TPA: hypothetical protein VH641_09520 [Streptosporangiaceae bacterium]